MKIGRSELIWNFISLITKIGANIILLPFILHSFNSEYVAVWNLFSMITPIIVLFDFGFSSIFTQNLIYVFSGSQSILKKGFVTVNDKSEINYSLLNDLINSMKWIYKRISFYLFIFLLVFGSIYLFKIIENTKVNKMEIYFAWIILLFSNTLYFYSFYYDSLLISSGKIKKLKQINVLGQIIYIVFSIILMLIYKSFIAIAISQLFSVLITRYLSYKTFYTTEINLNLGQVCKDNFKEVLKMISYNSRKLGFTALGGFLVQRSPFFIGGIFLSTSDMASYGITMQVIFLTLSVSTLYLSTKIPLVSKYRVLKEKDKIYNIYITNIISITLVYFSVFCIMFFFGNMVLSIIGSSTMFIEKKFLALGFLVSFIEAILSTSALILQTKNEVPFYIPSIISGLFIIIGIFLSFYVFKIGLISLFVIPLIIDLSYQGWKWPLEVFKDLKIK